MDLARQIDGILPYLKVFETPGFSFGHFVNKPGTFGWFDFSEQAGAFESDLYRYGWVQPFDWTTTWLDEFSKYVNDPAMVESADVETIRQLLTMHARAERFGEGQLCVMYESGHLTALLRRLKAIREGQI